MGDICTESTFATFGITTLADLARERGWRLEVSKDGTEERVIRPDGSIVAIARKKTPAPNG